VGVVVLLRGERWFRSSPALIKAEREKKKEKTVDTATIGGICMVLLIMIRNIILAHY
jgi:hypothetical protein